MVVEEEPEEEVGFVVDTSHPSESADNKITTTTTATTTTSASKASKSKVVMTVSPDYGHGPMTSSVASVPLALPVTVTNGTWEAYDPLAAVTSKKAFTSTATATAAVAVVGDSVDVRPFSDFTAIVPLDSSTSTTATIPATTAAAVTIPVATAIADESTVAGVPPYHKDGEPMYPTVVDVPLAEPDNANAPSAEKLGNEDALSTGTSTPSVKAKKGTTVITNAARPLTPVLTLPQGMNDIALDNAGVSASVMTSSSGRVSRPTMTPRTVKPAEYHGDNHQKKTHKPTHIEHDHNTRKPTHVEIGKATRKPTHLEGGDALKVTFPSSPPPPLLLHFSLPILHPSFLAY